MKATTAETPTTALKIASALFYGISSLAVIFVNKIVLSSYKFKFFYFLAATQFASTCFILFLLFLMRKVDIPILSLKIFRDVAPLFCLFFGNIVSGLGGTESLNLPMFTVLRRFSILLTMMGEYFILSKSPSSSVCVSVFFMIFGAIVAALHDLTFDLYGYTLVLLNNLFTALNGVYIKKASSRCSKMGILFYNSLFSFVALFLFFAISETQQMIQSTSPDKKTPESHGILWEIYSFPGWNDWTFCFLFVTAALLGSVLNYSIFLCTTTNSALTTAVIGCLKNVLVTYFSMLFLPDYQFHLMNFIGLNISILGSIYYTYITLSA